MNILIDEIIWTKLSCDQLSACISKQHIPRGITIFEHLEQDKKMYSLESYTILLSYTFCPF